MNKGIILVFKIIKCGLCDRVIAFPNTLIFILVWPFSMEK